MRFCDNCGSYMKETAEGFRCPRCGKLIVSKPHAELSRRTTKKENVSDLYVAEKPPSHLARVIQPCPECGNKEAFRWVSSISGEHAGVRRERTIEHFRCTKCSHNWAETS